MTLAEFCDVLARQRKTQVQQAIALLWWHDRAIPGAELSVLEICQIMKRHSLGVPKSAKLTAAIIKTRRAIRSGKKFKIRADARELVAQDFRELSSPAVAAPSSSTAAEFDGSTERLPPMDFSAFLGVPATKGARPNVAATSQKPAVFIGSSVEGLEAAGAIAQLLEYSCEATVWSDDVISLSKSTLEGLCDSVLGFDFAVLVLTPDDKIEKRGVQAQAARDNVVFELGLFIGALGRDRVFVVHGRDLKLSLPTDLAGITPATYDAKRTDKNLVAALHVAANKIRLAMQKAGPRISAGS